MEHDLPQHTFRGLGLVNATQDEFLQAVLRAVRERRRSLTVGYLNAAQVNLAYSDEHFARALAQLDWRYADGQAVVWAAAWRGAPIPERINAGDFTPELMCQLAADGLRLALVGGAPGEAERAAAQFSAWAPGLRIVHVQHGFFEPGQEQEVFAALDAADPDLVLLGMGAPRQEHWAAEWALRGRSRVYWCVGALFEYYAGTRPRAPRWMRRAGLEWLMRLLLEPQRLWRRYVIGNPLFVARVLRGKPPRLPVSRSF
jgi:N-acetylglucosaminyldiphosphoundecaprenol N-acetyl-beta-D-mannosaminyltransferase